MGTESKVVRKPLMEMLKENGFFAQAIESSTNPGMPDTWHIVDGQSGWVECKHVTTLPKRPDTSLFKSLNHPLSNEQEIWITRCVAKRGNAAILAKYQRRWFLVPGKLAEQFNSFTFSQLEMFEVSKLELIDKLRYRNEKQL